MLRRRRRREDVDGTLDARAERERLLLELDAPGLHLREVEDVVDDRQQGVARGADRLRVVALVIVELRVEHQAAHPDDRVHRRPDLVAHRREERALGAVCRFGSVAGLLGVSVEPGVVDRDRGVLGQTDQQVEVALRVQLARDRTPDGHAADDLIVGDEWRRHQPVVLVRIRARDDARARIGQDVVDELRIAGREHAPDDPFAEVDGVGQELLGDVAATDDGAERRGHRAGRGRPRSMSRRAGSSRAPRSVPGPRSDRAWPRSHGPRRPGRPSRRLADASRGRGARSGSRCPRSPRSSSATARRPARSGPPVRCSGR